LLHYLTSRNELIMHQISTFKENTIIIFSLALL
jgi:hypothetical protein